MMKDKVLEALNRQVNAELYAAYLYQAMSAYFESKTLLGSAKWMTLQAKEEIEHASKMYHYIIERGGRVELLEIKKPPFEWDSPLHVFEEAYKHEQFVTASINEITDLAQEKKDYATVSFLHWFHDEQVEEEAQVDEIIQKLKLVGSDGKALYLIDKELGQREG